MMFAAGRVAPALRGCQSCRTTQRDAGRSADPPSPPRARRADRRVAPLVLSAHACCCWLLRRTATASPPACLAGVATRRRRALTYTRARRAASSAFDVPRPPHVAGHGGAPSPALARRRPSAPPSRADAPPARVLPLERIVTPTGGLSSIMVAALSLFHPRTVATAGAHARARRETRRSAMLIERSSRSDRSRALSRPRRRGPRGSPAHGTAASSQRALSSSEIASPPDARGALSPRLLSLGAARCSPPRRDAEPPSPPPRTTCRPTGGPAGFVGAHLLLLAAPADSHRFPSCSPRVVVVRPFTPELGAPHHPRSPCRGRCPSPARAALHRQRSRAPAFGDGRVGATAVGGNAARALRRCWRMLRPRACSRLRAPSHWRTGRRLPSIIAATLALVGRPVTPPSPSAVGTAAASVAAAVSVPSVSTSDAVAFGESPVSTLTSSAVLLSSMRAAALVGEVELLDPEREVVDEKGLACRHKRRHAAERHPCLFPRANHATVRPRHNHAERCGCELGVAPREHGGREGGAGVGRRPRPPKWATARTRP